MSFIAILNNFLQCIAQLRDNADCADGLPYISGLPVKVAYVKAGQRHQTTALPSQRCSWNGERAMTQYFISQDGWQAFSELSLFKAVLSLCKKSFEERNANEGLQCDISHISFLDWLQNKKTGLKWKLCGQERESVSLLLAVCVRTRIESHMSCMACGRR